MRKAEFLESGPEDAASSSSEEGSETETETENRSSGEGKAVPYEIERLKRIEENKRRMEALGLRKMASSVMASFPTSNKLKNDKKFKRKSVDEDEEYCPDEDENNSSNEESESDDEIIRPQKKKVSLNTLMSKTQSSGLMVGSDTLEEEDDDALMQAIALSLQDSTGFLDVKSGFLSHSSDKSSKNSLTPKTPAPVIESSSDKRNRSQQDDSGRSKRKKPVPNARVQVSEDEMLIHFFLFDEEGNSGFRLRDVRRLAAAHDFTWSEKEMEDMIEFFDGDRDGKLSLEDFRSIVCRCNMLRSSENAV